jgi:hypothetical protein
MTYLKNKRIPFMVYILLLKIKNLDSKIRDFLASKFYTNLNFFVTYINREYFHHKILWKNLF